jgi:hypothetical protein
MPMSPTEYETALARFLAKKAIARCPTACATPTRGSVAETDKPELRKHIAARELARREKHWNFQRRLAV